MRYTGGAGIPDVLAGMGGPRRRGHRRRNDLCALAARSDACHTNTGGLCLHITVCSMKVCNHRGLGSHAAYCMGNLLLQTLSDISGSISLLSASHTAGCRAAGV